MPKLSQELKILEILIEKELGAHLKAQGISLTGTQLAVLEMVGARDGAPLLQKEIERQLRLSHPTTRGIVKRLIANDLLVATAPATDRRQVALYLTEAGHQLLVQHQAGLDAATNEVEARLLQGLTPEEVATLQKALPAMINNLDR